MTYDDGVEAPGDESHRLEYLVEALDVFALTLDGAPELGLDEDDHQHVHRGGGGEPDERAHATGRDRTRDAAGDHDDVEADEHLGDGGVGVGELAHVDDEERGGDDPVSVAGPADGLAGRLQREYRAWRT